MRQILLNSRGAIVARMPRPVAAPGTVLVRVHYSLVSVGTELAALRTDLGNGAAASPAERIRAQASRARHYARVAVAEPRRAVRKAFGIARERVDGLRAAFAGPPRAAQVVSLGAVTWTPAAARHVASRDGHLHVITDDSTASYQIVSEPIAIPVDRVPIVHVKGRVIAGVVAIGLLNERRDAWLATRSYSAGLIDDDLAVDPAGSRACSVVVSTSEGGRSELVLDALDITMAPPTVEGLPQSELDDQGWNVGYSAVGEVIEVGGGVTAFTPGDVVACAGAGQANHADYISVRQNLVCKLPSGCPERAAAFTTLGAIALQGVRRAAPQLGETVCVIGLGLIGQLTVQLLRAAGCRVIGMDLDPQRIARARGFGLADGASEADALTRITRDLTGGMGADRTLVTAATRSNAVMATAMEVTRRKGTVVIVGDVGLGLERAEFYKKELDLLMSTSYGPGRYDAAYEQDGVDYPYAYVRWTLNRNMQAFLALAADGRLALEPLVDRVVSVQDAPEVYKELAAAGAQLPMGVLIEYPDDMRALPEPADATRITVRGHRPIAEGQIGYALVGVGAFGTSMLVPLMDRRRDVFGLRAVVSRNTVQAGNFARANRVQVLATDLDAVLGDTAIRLVVIATRHHEHATQTIRALDAGKHVFVEKPLALTWEELDAVIAAYERAADPVLMVGFNRRFSPAIQALRPHLEGRRAPLVVSYRLNGGYIPPDSWIQGAQGGGRNLGEACHMYDVFRSLAGAPLRSVTAQAIDPGATPYMRSDNFTATLQYADGTLASLTYTALGPKQGFGKERIEVFCDGEAYVIDDFRSLVRGSDQTVLWETSDPDKGHKEEIDRWADALRLGEPSPIPFEEIVEVSAAALQVEGLLFGRGTDSGEFRATDE